MFRAGPGRAEKKPGPAQLYSEMYKVSHNQIDAWFFFFVVAKTHTQGNKHNMHDNTKEYARCAVKNFKQYFIFNLRKQINQKQTKHKQKNTHAK